MINRSNLHPLTSFFLGVSSSPREENKVPGDSAQLRQQAAEKSIGFFLGLDHTRATKARLISYLAKKAGYARKQKANRRKTLFSQSFTLNANSATDIRTRNYICS